MIKRLMSAFGWVRREDLDKANFERDMAIAQVGKLRLRLAAYSARGGLVDKNMALKRDLEECRKQLARKEAQYADAVSRWAGLARLWQEEHGGGLVYVKETADGGVQVWDEAVGEGCEPSAVIELKPFAKTVADGGDEECEAKSDTNS